MLVANGIVVVPDRLMVPVGWQSGARSKIMNTF